MSSPSTTTTKTSFKKLSQKYWQKHVNLIGPFRFQGNIIKGYQRGREIGIKTANLDLTQFSKQLQQLINKQLNEGVYIGYARINNDKNIYKNILSIGTNPHFKNNNITIESHLLHKFDKDFYDSHLRIMITGFIRPSVPFETMDDLIQSINTDIKFGSDELDKLPHSSFIDDDFLMKTIEFDDKEKNNQTTKSSL